MSEFDFDGRVREIEKDLLSLDSFKNLTIGSMMSIEDSLIETIEDSIVIAIYSLSEQMLKDTIYRILEVTDLEHPKSAKDIYILNQMPPDSYPITPKLDRIKKELKLYNNSFNLLLPTITENYKEAYNHLVKARHDYAHANEHTREVDFRGALEFVKYLRAEYYEFGKEQYLFSLKDIISEIKQLNFNKVKDYSEFQRRINNFRYEEKKKILDRLLDKGLIQTKIQEQIYEIYIYDNEYITTLNDDLDEILDILSEIDEESFSEKILELIEKIKKW
jgi:hypothetical protein